MKHDINGTACDGCKHVEVCKFKEEFLDAQSAVDNASISVASEVDGKKRYGSRPISCIDYILPIKLQCKYMEKKPISNIRAYVEDIVRYDVIEKKAEQADVEESAKILMRFTTNGWHTYTVEIEDKA